MIDEVFMGYKIYDTLCQSTNRLKKFSKNCTNSINLQNEGVEFVIACCL